MPKISSEDAERVITLFSILEQHHGQFDWWPNPNAYEIMLGAVLVQNTNWRNAQKALDNLEQELAPESIASMELEQLAQKIRPSGYYNQKALKLKAVTEWFGTYQYDIALVRKCSIDKLRLELLAIKALVERLPM